MSTLVYVASHPDDESISSAGLLLKARDLGYRIHILWLTRGQRSISATAKSRWDEALKVTEYLNASCTPLNMSDGEVSLSQVISAVEAQLRLLRASVVVWPHGEGREQHQDHVVLHHAMLNISKRSDYGFCSWIVAQPPVFEDAQFKPTLFIPFGRDRLDEMVALVSIYASEKRKAFTREGFLRSRAERWALEARTGASFAEPYQLIKGAPPQALFFARMVECYATGSCIPVMDALDVWETEAQEAGLYLLDLLRSAGDLTAITRQLTDELWVIFQECIFGQVRFLYFIDPYEHFILLDGTVGPSQVDSAELERANQRRSNWMEMLEERSRLQPLTLTNDEPSRAVP